MRSTPLLLLVAFSGCAPALHLTRPTPPEGNFGTVRTLPVTVSTDVGRNVENAVVSGLFGGEVPVPVSVDAAVRERFIARLQEFGFTVCPAAPCGDGQMQIRLTESIVGTELTSNGLRSRVRLTAKVVVTQNDGQVPYDFNFWDRRTGSPMQIATLVRESADSLSASFATTLSPGREKSTLPLEDGGSLSPGVNMLLSSQWDAAISYFSQLTQKEPDNAGAWYDLGVAWEAFGDWGQALAAYEQAAARDRKQTFLDAVSAARRRAPAQPTQAQGPVPQLIPAAP
ncbi:MAG TPA: tetratricopeptide repeat protein [Archangium sp.]